tara:strand:- start:9745 stop:10266 length:522 start_codon:yes stop_codon:yes gene_type:complete
MGSCIIIVGVCGAKTHNYIMNEEKINISFTGEYYNTLDSKSRLSIPAKFRKALNPINDRTFVLTRGFDNCLLLYPVSEWSKVEEQLSFLSSMKGRHRNFIRSIVRHASYLQYDSQGRIIIPENLCEYAKIDKEVAVIGVIKKIELWSPKMLDELDGDSQDLSDFEDLADEIAF